MGNWSTHTTQQQWAGGGLLLLPMIAQGLHITKKKSHHSYQHQQTLLLVLRYENLWNECIYLFANCISLIHFFLLYYLIHKMRWFLQWNMCMMYDAGHSCKKILCMQQRYNKLKKNENEDKMDKTEIFLFNWMIIYLFPL